LEDHKTNTSLVLEQIRPAIRPENTKFQLHMLTQLKIWREKFVRKKRTIRSFSFYFYVRFVRNFVWKERKRANNKQTLHGNWCMFCNNVLKFYTHTMDSLGENEFCKTNVKEWRS
jgi:hypothetical protein